MVAFKAVSYRWEPIFLAFSNLVEKAAKISGAGHFYDDDFFALHIQRNNVRVSDVVHMAGKDLAASGRKFDKATHAWTMRLLSRPSSPATVKLTHYPRADNFKWTHYPADSFRDRLCTVDRSGFARTGRMSLSAPRGGPDFPPEAHVNE
jgi:hypothetical protein